MPSAILKNYLQGEKDRLNLQEIARARSREDAEDRRKKETHGLAVEGERERLGNMPTVRDREAAREERAEKEHATRLEQIARSNKLADEDQRRKKQAAWYDSVGKLIANLDPDDLEGTKPAMFRELERIKSLDYPDGVVPPEELASLKAFWDKVDKLFVEAQQKLQRNVKKGQKVTLTSPNGDSEISVPYGSIEYGQFIGQGYTIGKKTTKVKPGDRQKYMEYEDEIFKGKWSGKEKAYLGGLPPGEKLSKRILNQLNRQRDSLDMPKLVEKQATETELQGIWGFRKKVDVPIYYYEEEGEEGTPVYPKAEMELLPAHEGMLSGDMEALPVTLETPSSSMETLSEEDKLLKEKYPDAVRRKDGVWTVVRDGRRVGVRVKSEEKQPESEKKEKPAKVKKESEEKPETVKNLESSLITDDQPTEIEKLKSAIDKALEKIKKGFDEKQKAKTDAAIKKIKKKLEEGTPLSKTDRATMEILGIDIG